LKGSRIGLVYDLRETYLKRGWSEEEAGEFDSIDTIDALDSTLSGLGYRVDRIGSFFDLAPRLFAGERWDLVFTISEGVCGSGREALVPTLLEQFGIPYTFSDPLTCAVTLDKGTTKRLLRDAGLPTAPFAVLNAAAEAVACDLPYPVFVKPLREGTSKGISEQSLVRDQAMLAPVAAAMIEQYAQPVIVEEYLPGREVTVGILGSGESTRVLGVLEVVPRAGANEYGCTFSDKEQCELLLEYRLVTDSLAEEASELALAAYRVLGCRDAGRVDLRVSADGRLHILEINPISGLNPGHSDLPILASRVGMGYSELIAAIVHESFARVSSDARSRHL
jgi:D-alanine-D-alanine ligase